MFYLPKPVSTHNSGLFYPPEACLIHKARFYLPNPVLIRIAASIAKISEACFIYTKLSYIQSPVLTKNAPTQKGFSHTLPESPLPSQKQAKLVLSAKACFYPNPGPHQKHPYTKGLFPHPPRIAAFIAKTSESCFIYQSLFLPTKLIFIHDSALFLSTACLTHEACFIYTKPTLSTLACSYPPKLIFILNGSQPIFPLRYLCPGNRSLQSGMPVSPPLLLMLLVAMVSQPPPL